MKRTNVLLSLVALGLMIVAGAALAGDASPPPASQPTVQGLKVVVQVTRKDFDLRRNGSQSA